MSAHRPDGALSWLPGALADLEAAGLRRHPRVRTDRAGAPVDGLVDLSSNDYLGLAGDPRLAEAAAAAVGRWGAGSGGSRLVTGGTALHRELEAALAAWKGTEDAVVFSSGYLANTGTIGALVGRGDAVVSDALNHASIIDGCRASGADVSVYPHADLDGLDRALGATAGAVRRLVVTDGVFSMDGDAPDLAALCEVAHAHGAAVLVDDAHGCGVLGPDGRGTAAAQGCAGAVDVHVGTLSKAFGAAGGYVTGSHHLCEWLRNRARGYVFDTAPSPAVVGAALAGLRISLAEPWRRQRALALAGRLAAAAEVAAPAAAIVPVLLGDAEAALSASARLADAGVLAVAIRPPSVPPGTARLRCTASAGLTDEQVALAGDALAALRTAAA